MSSSSPQCSRKWIIEFTKWPERCAILKPIAFGCQLKFVSNKLIKDSEKFIKYFRMQKSSFSELQDICQDDLLKENTNYRKAISPIERLTVTLRFLATGESFQSLAFRFRLGHETVRRIVKETVQVLWRKLQPQDMPVPDKHSWEQIANGFQERWQFPLCAGAIDGKHVQLKAPVDSGSQYFNYKGHYSIVLMAICDAKSKFIVIDVGAYGSSSDGGIFQDSNFFQRLREKRLHLPDPIQIPDTNTIAPYVFVGDEAFPLLENLMRPFPRKELSDEKRIFNYRLSRARKQIECAFGVLSSMWRILRKPIEVQVDFATDIVKATCVLHNYIQNREPDRIKEMGNFEDDTNSTFTPTPARPGRGHTGDGKAVRNVLMKYFTSPTGSVHWQTNVLI
ncbi:hypothetical protein RRG08_008605 [Elysia crispata]|uniref:DDE Tnp4 domain-containing protein n=1 Tax=Elysia crispata TaxID=231223 RepID=A0AAE1EBS5_9GAST|nr:hypothetical protein RRG08_008605 [Elysia crispata]